MLKARKQLKTSVDSDFINSDWLGEFCSKMPSHGSEIWKIDGTEFMLYKEQSTPINGYYSWLLFTSDEEGVEEFDICIVKRRDHLQNVMDLLCLDCENDGWNHGE